MNAKHTPGPWTAIDEGANCLFIRGQVPVNSGASISQVEYYSSIATVTQRDPHPRIGGGIHRNVTEANARLIAAAPELLEALQHIQRCIPIGGFAQIHYGSSTWEQIDAAIAKATGEQ